MRRSPHPPAAHTPHTHTKVKKGVCRLASAATHSVAACWAAAQSLGTVRLASTLSREFQPSMTWIPQP